MNMPIKPFRPTLAMWFCVEGDLPATLKTYQCRCFRISTASGFFRVDDRPDLFERAVWVCQTCASDLQRREEAEYNRALQEYENNQGRLDEDQLNTLRAARDLALSKSDYTQLLDNRTAMGEETSLAWDNYRAAVRAWFVTARDSGVVAPFPDVPG